MEPNQMDGVHGLLYALATTPIQYVHVYAYSLYGTRTARALPHVIGNVQRNDFSLYTLAEDGHE